MPFPDEPDVIVLPTGADTGARIVLDGNTNVITVYDTNNLPVITISAGASPSIVVGNDPVQAVIKMLSFLGAAVLQFDTNGPTPIAAHGQISALEANIGPGIPPNQLNFNINGPTDNGALTPQFQLQKIVGGNRAGLLAVELFTLTGAMSASGQIGVTRAVATNPVLAGNVTGDAAARVTLRADGALILGDGTAAGDARLFRSSNGQLTAHPINAIAAGNVAETWNGLVYQNAWADGTNVAGKYRKVASPANSIQLVGELVPGTKVDGTVIATLPVGYRPLATTSFPIAANPVPAGSTTPLLQVLANGQIQCFGLVAGTSRIYFSVIIPLDA